MNHSNLKEFAFKLSKKIQECIDNTTYIEPPLRASDLSNYRPIIQLVKDYGYPSLNYCLHRIVEQGLEDLVKGIKHEENHGRKEWYFYRVSPQSRLPQLRQEVRKLVITEGVFSKLFFSDQEKAVLLKYSKRIEDHVNNGPRSDANELQREFRDIALALLAWNASKLPPETFYEKLIVKYLLLEHYIPENK